MTSHATFLELAATGIDFPLSSTDRGRLDAHLAGCAPCARSAAALRSDAELIARGRAPRLAPGRDEAILRAVLRPEGFERPFRLILAVALLGLLLVGALVAGARLLQRETDPLMVVPSPPVATPVASPIGSGMPAPSSSAPTPSAVPTDGMLAVTHGDGTEMTWIETVDLATGATRRVADGRDPTWLGRSQVAYSCTNVGGDFTGICFIGLADSKPSTVVQEANQPATSPDGRRLALHRGMVDVGETWAVLANGNELVKVASGAFLRWSPDGTTLLGQPEGATAQVAVVRADGTGVRVLASGYDPAWSPDGASVAFAFADADGTSLRVADVASGTATVRYRVASPREIAAPAWLPGGALVFVLDGDLWRLDAGRSEATRLTEGLAVAADEASGPPAVSPDGEHVAFVTGSGVDARVGIASVDGGWALLKLSAGPVTQPVWAPGPVTLGVVGDPQLGSAWTEGDVPVTPGRPTGQIEAVAPFGTGFVAVGRGCTADAPSCEAMVLNSRDGINWEQAAKQDATDIGLGLWTSGPSVGMLDVATGTPGIVAVGYAARPEMRATAWFSTDGLTWTRTPLADSLDLRVNAVTWDGRRFIAVGEDRDPAPDAATIRTAKGRAAVWTSSDGRAWARVTGEELAAGSLVDTMEDPASGGISDVAAGNGNVVGVGSRCAPGNVCTGAIWVSTDGSAWQPVSLSAGSGVLRSVTASAAGFVAVGPSDVLTSADGRLWAKATFPIAADLKTVTRIGDRLFLAVQPTTPEAAGDQARLWVSADGKTWSPGPVQGGIGRSEPSPDATYWRFGAGERMAVWFAFSDAMNGPFSWYSTGS